MSNDILKAIGGEAMEMTDEEAEGKVVAMLRAGLPRDWKVESEVGEFTPQYWTKVGKGVEIRVTEPVAAGAWPMKGTGPIVWRYWLMTPGYDGQPSGTGRQKDPAMEWGLWRGRQVVCAEMTSGKIQVELAKALAATENEEHREAGNFQTFVSEFRRMATGTMRWVEAVNRVQHFTPLSSGRGDLLWLTSWPEPDRPNGMYIWIMPASFKGTPEKLAGGEKIRLVMEWNGRPVYVAGKAWETALEEVKDALRATDRGGKGK
jgi:hypothetical protein